MNDGLRFSGCIPANLLPFTADLQIDVAAYKKHLRWLADTKGVTGIVANGHAAEVSSLSREERRRALALALEEIGGKVPVIAGVYSDGTQEAVELARDAKAAGAQGRVEAGAVEAVVVVLGDHELVGFGSELGDDVDIGFAQEAGRGGQTEASGSAGGGATVLGVKKAHKDGHLLGIGEFGEDDGEALAAEEIEERADLGNDLPGRRHFHGLAPVEERPLHVHDHERSLARLKPQRLLKDLRAVHGDRRGASSHLLSPRLAFGCASNYHAATENAFGMCRIALTPPSSLTTTATTSKRHGCSRRRLSLR